jgi:hypothetical protein
MGIGGGVFYLSWVVCGEVLPDGYVPVAIPIRDAFPPLAAAAVRWRIVFGGEFGFVSLIDLDVIGP